jgi:hypothetical protein
LKACPKIFFEVKKLERKIKMVSNIMDDMSEDVGLLQMPAITDQIWFCG